LLKLDQFDDASAQASKSINLMPNNGYAYLNRGIAREMLRDKKGACEDWHKAEELGVISATAHISNTCN